MMTDRLKDGRGGQPVDSYGIPILDPTRNVLDLSEAANKRQDDLRDANNQSNSKWISSELARVSAELKHMEALAAVRDAHARELRESEVKRVDAIRQVDVSAAGTASDRALQAIQVLAATTTANAETLRQMVANTAQTIAAQTAATVGGIIERIANLEKSSYTGQGRSTVADPQMAEMMLKLSALLESRAQVAGKDSGVAWIGGLVVGAFGVITAIATIIFALVKP